MILKLLLLLLMNVVWSLILLKLNLNYFMFLSLLMINMMLIIWILMNSLFKINKNNNFFMNFIGFNIIFFILTDSMWMLYLFYELVMLPIIFLIMSYGINMLRFPASLYMIIYTMLFSLPSLLILLMNFYKIYISLSMSFYKMNIMMEVILFMMFLVKVPVFLLHYWLPKAHVEASTLGSMILASGLLKMGGIGIYKMIMWIKSYILNSMILLILSLFPTILCVMQIDFKKMIALMSVSHMTFALSSLLMYSNLSSWSFILLNVTHVFTSGLLFYFSGVMYILSKTRLMYLFMMCSYKMLFILMIISLFMNISSPPFFSMIAELLTMSILFCMNYNSSVLLILILVMSSIYTLLILNNYKYSKSYMMNYTSFSMFMIISLFMSIMWIYL